MRWCDDYNYTACLCDGTINKSPIIVDVKGDGFDLTDAFLFIDRNEDGRVNNGTELFGDVAPQIHAPFPNGFAALALYELATLGGNGDGRIDAFDAAYAQMRLWRDANHNGVSEPGELHTLPEMKVESISLDYRESGRRDKFGNAFRYRAKVNGPGASDTGRWAYDVFLVRAR